MSITALVVAAGSGDRFGGGTPKQYQSLFGQPMLRRSVATLVAHPRIATVRVVVNRDHLDLYAAAASDLAPDPIMGGATRRESALNGLKELGRNPPDHVLIHDGARPLVDSRVVDRVLDGLAHHDAVVPALPIADSIKRGAGRSIQATIDRTELWRAQTPQGFRFATIYDAAMRASLSEDFEDDAAIAIAAGVDVTLVDGDETNIKVTHPQDLEYAERLLQANLGDLRVGTGFDTHRFVAGDWVRLCGVDISSEGSLAGHSDADVALHAVTDALLGAIGEGDIGTHFPPSDARWRDADSQIFIAHAVQLIRARGGIVSHIDLTIICEQPKIAPHRIAMRDRLAGLLSLPLDRVSVKATTTERLGFTGRGEGIAVQAAATVRLPS
ncbi:MAG: bifunctional 2-C-methyl-D-erythritol 4-phosphate cytidylyltransferase/2-C-methyl-D-erythritol 2,4-cyclodiphosphate synthase [Proteobacteria bacterium]|nr:bifunctional 2-C-methyl-D-erythritol 4-phosphate cytidylyltransferase/2-C-methyl-D-erythritol 2,4-cyclodiphosphate synthase [Pseudomonadota bacterium]